MNPVDALSRSIDARTLQGLVQSLTFQQRGHVRLLDQFGRPIQPDYDLFPMVGTTIHCPLPERFTKKEDAE